MKQIGNGWGESLKLNYLKYITKLTHSMAHQ